VNRCFTRDKGFPFAHRGRTLMPPASVKGANRICRRGGSLYTGQTTPSSIAYNSRAELNETANKGLKS